MDAAPAPMGHNQPPPMTPFEEVETEIFGLFDEAKHWLDGQGVASEEDATGVAKLLDMIRKAEKRADEARKVEAKPFDDGKAEVQERYKPLLTRCKLAADAAKKALAPWLERAEAEKRAIAEAARREADEKARTAQEALRASAATDLDAREHAEALLRDARAAEKAASKAEHDKAGAKGGARAVTLRTTYRAEVTDANAFARFVWAEHRDDLTAFLATLANRLVGSGLRSLPGVVVHEERTAI